jgi:DNA-binding response OmpR family regulator
MDSVLIVDDDRELCELVKELLEEEGFKVETANNSAKGLERALSGQYTLVV